MNDLELCILRFLWSSGASTSKEIQSGVEKKNMAYSTVSLALRMLEVKGIIRHDRLGPSYKYTAVMEMETYVVKQMEELVASFFAGDRQRFAAFINNIGFCV